MSHTYLFVRQDLSAPQQIVQAAHAMGHASEIFGSHCNLVLCRCPDLEGLAKVKSYLEQRGVDHHMFWEPDIAEHTAIATRSLSGDDRRVMRRFQLVT